jgi:hypothetical protein
MFLPKLVETCKNEPPEAVLEALRFFYQDPYKSVEKE